MLDVTLAIHYPTQHYLHPFQFVLFMFKNLVAKQHLTKYVTNAAQNVTKAGEEPRNKAKYNCVLAVLANIYIYIHTYIHTYTLH